MSLQIFQFPHQVNHLSKQSRDKNEHVVYFLDEKHNIVPEHKSKKFVVKKRKDDGSFLEFFGVVTNPDHKTDKNPLDRVANLEEGGVDVYTEFGLNKPLVVSIDNKNIPFFTPREFIDIVPRTFGGVTRTIEQIAQQSAVNRQTIYRFAKTLEHRFIKSITDVNCNSVAYLYSYLNGGKKWVIGNEEWGFVDGLWENGGYVTTTVDTPVFDEHTFAHETGHSVSFFLVQDLFDRWYKIAIDKSELPPSEYAHTEVSEDFAETFGFYFAEPEGKKALMQACPIRYAFMQELDKRGPASLVSSLVTTSALTKRFKLYDATPYS